MAIVAMNELMNGLSGTIGNTLVFKTIRGKTFVSAKARIPDKKKESVAQRNTRVTFKKAAEWAKYTLLNPEKKLYYQQRAKALKLPNAYTAAIADYMRKPRVTKVKQADTITYLVSKRGFAIKQVRWHVSETATAPAQSNLITRRQDNEWLVYYTTDDGAPSPLTLIITDNTGQEIAFTDALAC